LKLRPLALLTALLTVAIATGVAGCGGGSDTNAETGSGAGSTGGSLTNAEFVKASNAICAKGIEEIEKNFEKFSDEKNLNKGEAPDKAEVAEAIETILIPGISKQLQRIGALTGPQGEEEAVEDFLEGAEAELKKAEKDPAALTSGASFRKSREEAQAIGISGCPAG
jgi:hypothetical protein